MTNKLAQPPIKLNYFYCQKGALHEGEVLNYVCIDKSCESKGLLCSVCKHDHQNHNVIPLKYLLNALKDHQQNQLSAQNFQSEIQELEKLKSSFLYELKIVVQKFAERIQEIQQKIVQQFKSKKMELMNQIEMSMKFNEIVEGTINNKIENQESFEKDFRKLASLIQNDRKSQNGRTIDNISFSINLKKIIQDYEQNYRSFSQKINVFLETSQLLIDKLLQPTKLSSIEPSKPSVPLPNLKSKAEYRFSNTYKTSNITLLNNNTQAECNSSSSQRFALVEGPAQKKGSSIRFRIEKLKNWIGLGLAIKNNIVGKSYQFLYNTVGHGSFLLSSNGYSWSHSNTLNNLVLSSFPFVEGNVIKIETNQTELIFTNQTQQNKVYKLPILLTQNEWKQACFCVNLTSAGDKVAVL